MQALSRLPLRQLLTLPYVLLVLLLAGVLGTLSYLAGRDAVDNLSGQLLVEPSTASPRRWIGMWPALKRCWKPRFHAG